MPREIHQGIRHHHQPEAMPADGPMGALLHVACFIANSLGKGIKAEAPLWELTHERLHLAGVSEEAAQECAAETDTALTQLKEQLSAQ
jgi:hypothetical protein